MEHELNLVDYSRQATMDESLSNLGSKINSVHTIVGCGGIGFWLALILAMLGYQKVVLIDSDKVDSTNIARLPVPQTWIGVSKVVALRKLLRQFRPTMEVVVINSRATRGLITSLKDSICKHYMDNILWDTTDDARSQQEIYEAVSSIDRLKYRKIGYEGWKVGNYSEMSSAWLPDEYTPGYRTSSANALSSVLAACIGILGQALATEDTTINLLNLLGGQTNE